MSVIGILHPGAMGAALGAALGDAGHTVRWAGDGRSDATRRRAGDEGFEEEGSLHDLVSSCEVLVSVCPPHAAVEVSHDVASFGFDGLYVDANAVAPDTARRIGNTVTIEGAAFVDGGIVGPPPRSPGATRLFLCGEDAREAAALFDGSAVEAVTLAGEIGAASALKMAYAAWTKGSAALLLTVRALAGVEGVADALLEEWARSQPQLPEQLAAAAQLTAPKAWRFAGEMDEIAATLDAAGLPPGFHEAAADLYRRLDGFKDADAPTPAEVFRALEAER